MQVENERSLGTQKKKEYTRKEGRKEGRSAGRVGWVGAHRFDSIRGWRKKKNRKREPN
jgi:hypothetical protein